MNVSSKQSQFDQISKVNPGQTAAKNWVDINRNCIFGWILLPVSMSVLSLCLVLVYILYIKINGSVKEKKKNRQFGA